MIHWLRTILASHAKRKRIAALEAGITRRLDTRRIARKYRSEAAKRGQSTEIKRRAAQCRKTFANLFIEGQAA
jgi:hypothetical protein